MGLTTQKELVDICTATYCVMLRPPGAEAVVLEAVWLEAV